MPDALQPDDISRREFEVVRRGYDQAVVRGFLSEVSSQLARLLTIEVDLKERLAAAERKAAETASPSEATMIELLGEETTRVLTSAREAAVDIKAKAEQSAERIIAESASQAAQTRSGAVAEADKRLSEVRAEADKLLTAARSELEKRTKEAAEAAERITAEGVHQAQVARDDGNRALVSAKEEAASIIEAAKAEGKQLVIDAQAVRESVLKDLSTRRKKARQQIEQLNAGRERLLQAYDVVRGTIDDATKELSNSVNDAREAASAAARRVANEPDLTPEQLDREVHLTHLEELPITATRVIGPPRGRGAGSPAAAAAAPAAPVPAPVVSEPEPPAPPAEVVPPVTERRPPAASDFDPMPEPASSRPRRAPDPVVELELELEPEAVAPEPEPIVEEAAAPPLVEPEPQPVATPEPVVVVVEPEPEPEPEVIEAPPREERSPASAVFARLHAEVDEPPAAGEVPVADEPEPAGSADAATAHPAFAARSAAIEAVEKDLGKRLKRALADEQNEVLDRLRRGKPAGVDDLLPSADEHTARWAEASSVPLAAARSAGASWSGGPAPASDGMADELARNLVLPLRERIERSFAASDGNLEDVADRVRALYREWKNQRLTEAAAHYAAAAYARGVFEATPPDAKVQWLADASCGACPDCEDNVLAGPLLKGEEFPTGDRCAPAHPGCRCLVLVALT